MKITSFGAAFISLGFSILLAIFLGFYGLNSPDPLDDFYRYSGVCCTVFIFVSIALSLLKAHKYARGLGLGALFFAALHFLNFIWLDKDFSLGEIWFELRRNTFIWLGILSFIFLVFAGIFSTKRRQNMRKSRRVFVLLALIFAAWHGYLAVKIPKAYEWGVMIGAIFVLCFKLASSQKRPFLRDKIQT